MRPSVMPIRPFTDLRARPGLLRSGEVVAGFGFADPQYPAQVGLTQLQRLAAFAQLLGYQGHVLRGAPPLYVTYQPPAQAPLEPHSGGDAHRRP
jgi:hypothetical protein